MCPPYTEIFSKRRKIYAIIVWRAWVTLQHVKFDLVWLMYQNQGAWSLKIWINALCCQQASTQPISMFSLQYCDIVISVLSCNEDWLWTKNGDSQLHLFNVKWFLKVTLRNLFHRDIELKRFFNGLAVSFLIKKKIPHVFDPTMQEQCLVLTH